MVRRYVSEDKSLVDELIAIAGLSPSVSKIVLDAPLAFPDCEVAVREFLRSGGQQSIRNLG